jgi:iron complex outermembrane recepter protein
MRHFGRTILLATAGFAGLSSSAFAQAPADEEGLDEIVVTANKREENLQQTPLAISAVGSEQLELRGLGEIKDLSAIAPNVSIVGGTTNATAAVVVIRGIPTPADETQGFDSPVGLYLDGVYLARSSAASFEVADVERVEVLRGPQGTLFGRNTTGGAINFITKRPEKEASAKIKLGIGNYDQRVGRFILNSGDIGGARLSLGYLHKQRDGTVDNLLEPKDSLDPGGHKVRSARFAVEADVTDRLTIYNVFDFTRISGTPGFSQLAEVGNGVFRPNLNLDGSIATVQPPATAANVFAAVQPANVGGYLALASVLEPGCNKLVTRARQDTVCNDSDGISIDKVWGNMLRLEENLDWITIRSTTAIRKWKNDIQGTDLDGLGTLRGPLFSIGNPATPFATFTGFPTSVLTNVGIPAANAAFLTAGTVPTIVQPLFSATNKRSQKQFSQEIELVSAGDGPFQWVLGGFYFDESGREVNPQRFGFVLDTNQAVYTTPTAQSILTGFGYPLATAQALAPGLAAAFRAANPAQFRVVPQASTLAYTAGGQSTAIYGQASYRPGGKDGSLGVTLGLRYTWDKKDVNRTQNGAAAFSAAEQALNIRSKKFSAPSGHLTVDYRANDDMNFYGRIARGYRSGGFNLRQSTSVANNIPLIPFNEETIWSYEIGAKTEFMNRIRLNAAVFHNVYSDQLATIPIPITGGGSFGTQTVNAGKTTYTGFEVEGQFKLTDNISIDGNFGYIDIKIKDFPGADSTGVVRNVAGPLLAGSGYAPKYTGSIAANVTVPLSGDARLTGRLGYNYTAGYQQFPNRLTAPFSQTTEGDSRGLVDGQIRIEGLKFGSGSGDGIGLTFWGKNLTNKKYVIRSVDFGQLGFATVIYGDPRTYGVTLDFGF